MIRPIKNDSINLAKELLLSGKPIIYPTDTLFSFGAIATDTKTIIRINKLKKRESPLSIILSQISQIEKYGHIKKDYFEYIKNILPGKYTILIKSKKHDLSYLVQNKSNLIGVRIPKNDFAINLVKSLNAPIITTSVNIHGTPPLIDVDSMNEFYPEVDIFYSKRTLESKGSTILDLTNKPVKLVRLGDEINY